MTTIAENEDHLAIITNNSDFSTPIRKQQANEPDEGYLRQTFNNLTIDQSLMNLERFNYSNLSTFDQRPEFNPTPSDIGEHYQSPFSSVQQAHVFSSAFETPFTPSFYDQTPAITNRSPSIDPNTNDFQIINKPSK